jgi:hypothetical protein
VCNLKTAVFGGSNGPWRGRRPSLAEVALASAALAEDRGGSFRPPPQYVMKPKRS